MLALLTITQKCLLQSLSNVTSLWLLYGLTRFGHWIQLLHPSPTPIPAPSCSFSEFVNGDHVSGHPNVWSELAFEDAVVIFADFCPVLLFGTPGWLFAFLNVNRLRADEF